MSNREMLSEILNDEFFFNTVPLTVVSITREKGVVTPVAASPVNIDAIVQNTSSKDLQNAGLGIYSDKENKSLFTAVLMDFSKSNFITHDGKTYKVVNQNPWKSYGFYKYIMTQYNGDMLNDN